MRTRLFIALFLTAFVSSSAIAAPRIVFSGTPSKKMQNAAIQCDHFEVPDFDPTKFKLIITEENGRYFWTTRDDTELTKVVNSTGAYTTYIANNGVGFVRIQDHATTAVLHSKIPSYTYDYMEILLQGLTTITYFGSADK